MNGYIAALVVSLIVVSTIILELTIIKYLSRRSKRHEFPEMNEQEIKESTKLFWNKKVEE